MGGDGGGGQGERCEDRRQLRARMHSNIIGVRVGGRMDWGAVMECGMLRRQHFELETGCAMLL